MTDYEIGYGKPPQSYRFKAGKSGNPKGRPKAVAADVGALMAGILNAPVHFRLNGRSRTAIRRELVVRSLTQAALKGDASAVLELFRRWRAARRGGQIPIQVQIVDWLPDFPGQTAGQKNAALGSSAEPPKTEAVGGAAAAQDDEHFGDSRRQEGFN